MRIFLASPSDVTNYREAAQRVAERLNQQGDAKLGSPFFLEVVDWNSHIAPHLGLPESAILEEISVEENDVFLGIAWLGFDRVDHGAVGDGGGTGSLGASTERNFEIAFNYWREQEPTHCLLCRCMRLPEKLTDIDGRAFDRVTRFFSRFSIGAANPVSYYEFSSATDLEEHLADQLGGLIESLGGEAPIEGTAAEVPKQQESGQDLAEFERKMEAGKAYEVSFLSIEIQKSEAIQKAEQAEPEKIATLFKSFRELVLATAANYGGELFNWQGNAGLLIFWRSRSFDHAIMTGLKVLHNLPVFNLDTEQNPLGANIQTRSAAHDAVIIFQLPAREIRSADIDFVVKMQRQTTDSAELTITRRLFERVDNRLKPHFKFKERFEGEPVYACRLPSAGGRASTEDLEDVVTKLRQHTALNRQLLNAAPGTIELGDLETMSTAIDEIYSILGKFCTTFTSVDREWSAEFIHQLANTTATLMGEEAELWKTLRKVYVEGKLSPSKATKLEAIVQAASRRRSRPVVILEKLEERCRTMTGDLDETPEPTPVDEDLAKRVDAFVRADALDNETALTELLLHHKGPLFEYITLGGDEQHSALLDKLWESLDLALLDDLYSIRGRQRADEPKVMEALVDPGVRDLRFRVIQALLHLEQDPSEEQLRGQFRALGLEPSEADLQVVWRCLVIGHKSFDVCHRAALQLTPHSMWQVISHPSIPIPSIHAIGQRIHKGEGEDAQKIFFDCIRARLEGAVESFRTKDEVTTLTKLVLLLLELPFLVETGYFERFDDILRRFLERSQKAGLKVEYFENLRKTLEEARAANPDKGPSKPPSGIKKLPLTIQRRLAGESRYVYWFVSHPDPRIASETLRHVGLMNIERVLRLREVNAGVMQAILRKPELFTRAQALLAALNHPKCTQEFAARYVPNLARTRQGAANLQKIVNNPSANPVVRAAAKRAMAGVSQAGRR